MGPHSQLFLCSTALALVPDATLTSNPTPARPRHSNQTMRLPPSLESEPPHAPMASRLGSSSSDELPIAGPSHSNGTALTRFMGAPLSPRGESNGYSTNGQGDTSTVPPSIVRRVSPPGTTLYKDSTVDREEFVRLVLQSLRDVGYKCVFSPLYHRLQPNDRVI